MQVTKKKYIIMLIDWNNSKSEEYWNFGWISKRKEARKFITEQKALDIADELRSNIGMYKTLHIEEL